LAQVIVVDDDPANLNLASWLLGERFDVITFEDGTTFLEQVDTLDPVSVLIDLSMPGLDGLEVCAEMKRRRPELLSRCVLVTADVSRSIAQTARETTGVEIRTRPFREADFMGLISLSPHPDAQAQ
jgi:CheY-like chemotaxis protein